jgi:hypothetical protein
MQKAMLADFYARMTRHLLEFFPNQCVLAGPDGVQTAIEEGIERSFRHEITNELDVARFIDISFIIGSDFDDGIRYPWANEILAIRDLRPDAKLEMLFDQIIRLARQHRAPVINVD